MFSFGKIKNKLSATRFEFSFFVHNLQPWPAGNRAIAIGYQRGKRRRGATRSVYPSTAPGKVGNVVRFNEKFEIPSTLYKAATGKSEKNTEFGPFKKKCLILAILETDGQTQATAALGRVVIDLAEFAAVESQETRTFQVACNKAIHAAVGDPLLMVTIRCRWKKAAAGPAGPGMPMDDTQSMSTDTTGSRMTANLSSFLRFRFKGGPQVNEEQDLGGFDKPKDSTATNYMDTIQESHDDEPEAAEAQKLTPTNSRLNNAPSLTPSAVGPTASVVPLRAAAGAAVGAVAAKQAQGVEVYAAGHGDKDSEPGGEEDSSSGGIKPLRPATSNFAASPLSATAAPRSMNGTSPPPSYAREVFPRGDLVASSSSRSRAASDRLDSVDIVPGVRQELLTVAAAEVAIYLPQSAATRGPPTERMVHAPARRLARTMVSLGSGEGQVFGAAALRLIERHILAPSADMTTLAFWWSNLVHLRAMLQGLGLANTLTGGASAHHWAADSFVVTLQRLERAAFDEVVSQAWDKLLAPVLPGAKSSVKPAAATKRATQEAAIKKWFEGLDAVNDCLTRLGSSGHLDVLKQQVLLQCLKKLDTLMFYHLLAGGSDLGDQPLEGLMKEYDPNNTLWGGPGRTIPPLDDSSLPFARGVLTFGGGMSVKMTVTRLQQWAAGESALTELLSRAVDGGSNSLFPLLRAAADLLMMPKELLMDRAIRLDVCSALSMGSVLHILEQFQPDEFAHDTINPAILQSLQEEAIKPFTMRNPAADISGTYRSPSDHSVLQKMEAGTEPGLEYDFESEAELDQVREMWACAGAGTSAARYKLLHDLWASNVPRKRATAPA